MMFVLRVFLAGCFVSVASSCSCRDTRGMSLDEIRCKADYMIMVRVEGSEEVESNEPGDFSRPNERKYRISILEEYKTCGEYNDVEDKSNLYTSVNSGLCGVYLQENSTYVIADYGGVRSGKLRIGLCSLLYRPVEDFTTEQLIDLKKEYYHDCNYYCSANAFGVCPAWILILSFAAMAIY